MSDPITTTPVLPVTKPPAKPWQFQKGKSGNPRGRIKNEVAISELTRKLLESKEIKVEYSFPKNGVMIKQRMYLECDRPLNDLMIFQLIKQGMDGDIAAIREVFDRGYGKAPQHTDITTAGDKITQRVYNITEQPQKEKLEQLHNDANNI
jgi:hypothetical protein